MRWIQASITIMLHEWHTCAPPAAPPHPSIHRLQRCSSLCPPLLLHDDVCLRSSQATSPKNVLYVNTVHDKCLMIQAAVHVCAQQKLPCRKLSQATAHPGQLPEQ
jgi:hypothetical protein